MDVMKEDVQGVVVTEDDASDWMRWKQTICYGDPRREQLKGEEVASWTGHCNGMLVKIKPGQQLYL